MFHLAGMRPADTQPAQTTYASMRPELMSSLALQQGKNVPKILKEPSREDTKMLVTSVSCQPVL